ncbi:hypothetical protein GCM10025882_31580 [Acinetobacter gyllenbergii]|uniref:Uncharacterized protein n=1 Tax=Acinetobacter gyllenbergii CIP 110306 = MTCC 11365 TaxID=1217657 RepID=A0A829HGZ9_9GAMM|nr:hypothetical protein [Acinetobacter gyllenbergii]EPF81525.1 hypothetical protein F957_02066 [Acinetobacter gyllenbergii CIP 110306 = MTCC 11365]EPH31058.1 hypothetical protein L293_2461 [Acinetobacter gyllenbergii CIP 110306 = MTCC 11365]GMA12733.1 hypothetical protein GCM10025882_31580 [Acinetobacter gyllenbergii]
MACYHYKDFFYCLDLKIFIPLIGPLLTLLLGIMALPFIERFKKRIERIRLLKALREELSDELIYTEKSFSMLITTYQKTIKLVDGEKVEIYNTSQPGVLTLYSVSNLLENHFENLDSEVRQSLKNLKENMDFLNNLDEKLHDIYKENVREMDTQEKIKKELSSYLCLLLIHRYSITHLIDILRYKKSELKNYRDLEYPEAISTQLIKINRPELQPIFNFEFE